jgi:3-deoxy-D-manno-octulosonate 8-phosphate phosphatase (KDO 8-P phosphatase)
VKPEETLYMGDEYFDLPILNACGFSATVSNASYPIKKVVDYITINQAGNGAVREVIDILLWVNNHQVKIEEL